MSLDSDDAMVLGRAGWALAFVAGELDEGADYLRRATNADPNSAYAWTFRGMSNVSVRLLELPMEGACSSRVFLALDTAKRMNPSCLPMNRSVQL
jgi:hypothetical protein